MPLHIYNSLTGKKEEFVPIKKGRVGIYVCGPTVYDEPHIGHARSGYIFEVVRNYFGFKGYKVRFVKNITDVDDKIIEKARAESRKTQGRLGLKAAAAQVAGRYLRCYYEDMERVGVKRPDFEPKATGYIKKMIRLIKGLMDKGFAYSSDGNVYFDVRKFSGYGKLSGQSIEKMEAGIRVHADEKKKRPLDFALWKSAKPDEPSWPSPWGCGRPGWHIECSTMSMDILGENFDIHAGGLDLIFPHHENEVAQSEAYSGKRFANYWMHNGLLTIGKEKMAKSLGNFITIKEILHKYHPEALKLFFLSGHYRSPMDFAYDRIEGSKRARERFYILFERIARFGRKRPQGGKRERGLDEIDRLKGKFIEAMDDDFNTPLALGYLFEIVNYTNRLLDNGGADKAALSYSKNTLFGLGAIFGLFGDKQGFKARADIEDRMAKAIAERERARGRGDYNTADRIRKELYDQGILLEDTKDKTIWRRRI